MDSARKTQLEAEKQERDYQIALRDDRFTVLTDCNEVELLMCSKCLGDIQGDDWYWLVNGLRLLGDNETWGDGYCSSCGNVHVDEYHRRDVANA
jgi:hypothetical protein